MRKKIFDFLVKVVVHRTGTILLLCALITIVMILGASRVRIETDIVKMLPDGYPQVEELKTIAEDFGSTGSGIMTIESKAADTELIKKCAEDMAGRIENMYILLPKPDQKLTFKQKRAVKKGTTSIEGVLFDTVYIAKRVQYRVDTEFINRHGFMIQKENDLKNGLEMYSSVDLAGLFENINDNFEKEYIKDNANLSSFEGEQQALYGLGALGDFVDGVDRFLIERDSVNASEAAGRFISGPEYMISPDKSLLIIQVVYTAKISDNAEEAGKLGTLLVEMINEMQAQYPDLILGATGDLIFAYDIMECTKKDMGFSSIISLALILVLLIGSFGAWKNPFYAIVALITALIWTTGFIGFTIHYLNMMSVIFGIILIGLGIDFGIHFISGFRDGRNRGLSIEESVRFMYEKFGNGVITGALTTAIAFFSLSFSGFSALLEMGVACGSGIIFCLISMMVLFPALVVWNNKEYSVTANAFRTLHCGFIPYVYSKVLDLFFSLFRLAPFRLINKAFSFSFLEQVGKFTQNLYVSILVLVIAGVTVYLSISNIKKIGYEYNMMELEAEDIMYSVNQRKILKKFEMSPDFVMLIADDLEDCREKSRKIKKIGDKTGMVGRIDAVSEFLPSEDDQKKNIPLIESFRKHLESQKISGQVSANDKEKICVELDRLHKNIVEIGELSIPAYGQENKLLSRCDMITGKKDEQSKILRLIKKINEGENAQIVLGDFQKIAFDVIKKDLLLRANNEIVTLDNLPVSIKERYTTGKNSTLLMTVYPKGLIWDRKYLERFTSQMLKVSKGTTAGPIIGLLFFDVMIDKGKIAIIYALMVIMILLLLDYRSFKYMIFAVIPVLVGACWMVGGMNLAGIKFNIANFMMLPLILGIGIDDGVHILHRYRIEGKHSIPIVLRYTGRAVLLTSLTTMIAFGSMSFGARRGNASAALVLVLGVGACLISSVFVLPSIICLYEKLFKRTKKRLLDKQ